MHFHWWFKCCGSLIFFIYFCLNSHTENEFFFTFVKCSPSNVSSSLKLSTCPAITTQKRVENSLARKSYIFIRISSLPIPRSPTKHSQESINQASNDNKQSGEVSDARSRKVFIYFCKTLFFYVQKKSVCVYPHTREKSCRRLTSNLLPNQIAPRRQKYDDLEWKSLFVTKAA